jgi:pyruvate kinase
MRRTRILATIGPASSSSETIAALIAAGTDAFRLNFSHGTRETHAEVYRLVRQQAAAAGRPLAVLLDLGGPKIRIGLLGEPMMLEPGDLLTIHRGDFVGSGLRVACSFDALFTSVAPGDALRIDDGRIGLVVESAADDELTAKVVEGGLLQSGKGINLPSSSVRTSAMSEKDRLDLAAGIEMGVDVVALSFVQSAADLVEAREVARSLGAPALPIVAKIEKPQAVDHLEAILEVADGVMVARGDLGVEVPLETVPTLQRRIVSAARRRGVPVILATQVFESMRAEPRPTRAEVTDAAHAVGEGVDAIMLSGETAAGQYPVRAVSVLDLVIREAEHAGPASPPVVPEGARWTAHSVALCQAAIALASTARAGAIVALTRQGKTARLLAAMRPPARVLAVTPDAAIAGQLSLVWGITPVLTDSRAIAPVRKLLVEREVVSRGDVVVFVSVDAQLGHENINFVHVEKA